MKVNRFVLVVLIFLSLCFINVWLNPHPKQGDIPDCEPTIDQPC